MTSFGQASIAVRIWQSDSLIDQKLYEEFLACVEKLEDVPDELKDWHPRANGQVLDLVHPSLYCLDTTLEASQRCLEHLC